MKTKSRKKGKTVVEKFVSMVIEQLEIKGMTRSKLAREAEVGRAYLYRVLDGDQVPSFDWAEKVGKVLGIVIEFQTK